MQRHNLSPNQVNDGTLVGIDMGGTATRFVSLDGGGKQLAQWVSPTPNSLGAEAAQQHLFKGIDAVLDGRRPTAIGIGASGPIDAQGVIRNPVTLPAFTGMNLMEAVRTRYGVACVMENDAVTAAYGEYALGSARGSSGVLMITLGTGVGVCMLQNGNPVRGADGIHPEAGHMRVDGPDAPCYCGKRVCWEQLASRTALQRHASALFPQADGLASILCAQETALRGNTDAKRLFEAYGISVALGLANLLALYRPNLVVIGGAAAQYLDLFQPSLSEEIANTVGVFPPFHIAAASLADLGGALGAAMWAKRIFDTDSFLDHENISKHL
jgi:glucokinase